MKINPKSEKGAITLIVLVTMLFLIAFLMSMYIRISNKAQTSAETTEEIAKKYNNIGEANDIYNSYFTNSDVIPIYTVEQLKKIGSGEKIDIKGKIYTFTTNGYYTLMNDLDLGGYYDEENETWTGTQWEPLPLSDSNGTQYEFIGTLDGLGNTISGIYIDNPEESNQGLFGILEGTVKNLIIINGYINGKNNIGVIAGKNNGTIKNCYYRGITMPATLPEGINVDKGSFVEYGVAYADAYIPKEYRTTNGWRLLDYTDNGDGTISNVKLISTGIPAKLYYNSSDSSTNKSWWVTTESSEDPKVPNLTNFREILGGENYPLYTGTSTYYALQASAGMYYNFKDIKFAYEVDSRGYNLGYFSSITVYDGTTEGGTTYDANNKVEKTGNELFKVRDDVTTVRLLTLKEVNEAIGRNDIDSKTTISTTEDSIGLYRLDQLKNVTGMSTYNYDENSNGSISSYYLLASPYPSPRNTASVCYVQCNGRMDTSISDDTLGVRPVVFLESNIRYTVNSGTDSSGITYLILTAE